MMNAEKINMDHEGVEVPDYYGEDGLLHCGVCHEPKEAYLPEGKEWLGRSVFCQALFPEKSVGIPFFHQGIFPVSSGHYASLRIRACSIR